MNARTLVFLGLIITSSLSFAEATKLNAKEIFADSLASVQNIDQAFVMLAFNEKHIDSLLNIARDLKEANFTNTLPKISLQDNKIFIEGVYSGVSVTSYSPVSISSGGNEWTYSKSLSLDENYFALKKLISKRRKQVSKWSLVLNQAYADRLRPELPKGYDNEDLVLDVAITAAVAPLAGSATTVAPVLAALGVLTVSTTLGKELDTKISCDNGEFTLINEAQSSSLKIEVTPGNQKNKYFIEDLKTHQIKEIPARDVRENRMTLDKVAGYCKQGLITAGMNSSLNEALQKGRIASNALRAKNNPAINSSAVTNGTR